jgi:hypothetical protein
MQIDADTVPDPAYHFDADLGLVDANPDPDADPGYQNDSDPDPQH